MFQLLCACCVPSHMLSLKYLVVRCFAALFTSFISSMYCFPKMIKFCNINTKFYQPIRSDGPVSHIANKQNTPSMGGTIIILSSVFAILLWGDLTNLYLWLLLATLSSFGAIGFYDDYKKIISSCKQGLSVKKKFFLQILCALLVLLIMYLFNNTYDPSTIVLPFFNRQIIHLNGFYYIFAILVIVGSSNAVNLTDGLDGLAIVPVVMVSLVFALLSCLTGSLPFSEYLGLFYVPGSSEISIICSAIIGSGLGFLWFNSNPAKIFMGDTGSLSLGAVLGVMSVIVKQEVILFIAGFLFVLEALSVVIQVSYYKLYRKRVFKMAPLHHHFEKSGSNENTLVIRFWIVAFLLALIALGTIGTY